VAISSQVRQQIISDAGHRCEYCKTSSKLIGMPLTMEHIQPRSLGGSDLPENLAAACYRCNEFKGSKINLIDPVSKELISLFNPRLDLWNENFSWIEHGTIIEGISPIGRVTIIVLRLNNPDIVAARALWIEVGWHPPK
jgi:HNH endonuclease